MKLILPLIVFLMAPVTVLADITVSADKPSYSFGDLLRVSYDVSTDADFSGLTQLSLTCTNFGISFYTLPTSLFAGQSQTVVVPGLGVVPNMSGKCYVEAVVLSFDNAIHYTASSESFNVTGDLPISVKFEKSTFSPSEEIRISGVVGKSYPSRSSVALSFLGDTYTGPVINNSFAYIIRLPYDVRSGEHVLDFVVNDSFGNSGTTSASFTVRAVPTSLSLDVGEGVAKPGESVEVSAALLDQAGDEMNEAVDFSLLDSAGDIVLYGSNTTPALFGLNLRQSLPPGTYTAKAASAGLLATSMLVVEPLEAVSVSFDNRTLTIVNTGNVNYAKELVINLTGAERGFLLSEQLALEPGQATVIDLYREVPEDDYKITLPELPDAPAFEAHLEDERPAIRKASDFMGITGRVVQTGTPGIQTIISPLILVVIIFLIIFFFSRNRGKPASSANDSEYAAEIAALKRYIEDRHEQQKEESAHPQTEQLSRDDEAVKKFMENLGKDKPFR